MPTEILIYIPACDWFSANHRMHHLTRAAYARRWRAAALTMGRRAIGRWWEPWDRWSVEAVLAWGDRRYRDPHNYASTVVKACIDGLVDVGLATDDDSRHLIAVTVRRHPSDGLKVRPGVYLTPIREGWPGETSAGPPLGPRSTPQARGGST